MEGVHVVGARPGGPLVEFRGKVLVGGLEIRSPRS